MSTARKLSQKPQAEDKYRALFDHASDAILAVLPSGSVEEANLAVEELTGYLRSELKELGISVLYPDPAQHRIPARSRPLSREMFLFPGTYEDVALVRKDGFVRLIELSTRKIEPSASRKESISLALLRDVTERKKLERELITKHQELRDAYRDLEKANAELKSTQEMLVQAGKMAALGELTAGISHEINQPLQAIRGYAQEVQATLPDRPELKENVAEIVSGVDKIVKIIDQLRTFTRKSVEALEWVDLTQVIRDSLKLFDRQLQARGIEVSLKLSELAPVYANPTQLEQVFINLIANARDAIDQTHRGKGSLRISGKLLQPNLLEICIEDDGIGMNEATKSKVFNPFFTTKDVGKGMGLGLSLSYGILTKIHASIVIESEPRKGTRFVLKIPTDFRKLG